MLSITTEETTPPRPGLFLVLEGVEGCGKSSQQALLSARLDDLGVSHLAVREPGDTLQGEKVREVLHEHGSMTPEMEMLLYIGARAELVRTKIMPALEEDRVVIADRFELSTFAYQGIGRRLGLGTARALNAFATGGLQPDATFLLVVEPDVGRKRGNLGDPFANQGWLFGDRIEGEVDEFHQTVAEAYDSLADTEPNVTRIAGDEPVEAVHEALWTELVTRWPDRFGVGEG